MKHALVRSVMLSLAGSLLASELRGLHAQNNGGVPFPQASPQATVKENVGLSTIEIEYCRPGVKGRKIFGGLVPYDQVWRTGANSATKVTFSAETGFGNEVVPAGSYALFTIPGEKEWTVILNEVVGQWGAYSYDEKNDAVRIQVKPVALAEPVETFTIAVTDLRDDSAQLALSWEKTRVSIPIKTNIVETLVPQIEAAMTKEGDKPYFAAAMFYYEHGLDLKKAEAWIDEALKGQPDAVWIVYRKGLIQAKAGNKAGALATAKHALELAAKAGGELGAEYKRLSEQLIASLQ